MTATPRYRTREQWLNAAAELMRPWFRELDAPLPETVAVSCGWPGGGNRKTRVGECWTSKASGDGRNQVFISPTLSDPAEVLHVLLHELVHAADDCQNGHGAPFRRIAKSLGLDGKMTATAPTPELLRTLRAMVDRLGPYPHGGLKPTERKKQTTRMKKAECPESGYKVRLTRQWLEEYGAPICPCCHETMDTEAA